MPAGKATKVTGKNKKSTVIAELTDKVAKSKAIIFTDYKGLKHKQLEELRKKLKTVDGEFVVTKNRLLKRALGESATGVDTTLETETGTLFSYKDEVNPLKEMLKYFKEANAGKLKGGLLGTVAMTESDVKKLSELPSKEQLIAKVVGQMKSPLYGLHYALQWNINKLVWAINGIKDKKN